MRSLALAWIACLVGMFAPRALGQAAAPEGNAHPEAALVSEGAPLVNPFGEAFVGESSRVDAARRHAFAQALDLDPIRRLALSQPGGRVKIADTMARETVLAIVGRKDYVDVQLNEDGKPEKLHYDPVFTWLDLMIDPSYYADKPLIHVEYLPLREAILERAFAGDKASQERWKKLTRVTPIMVGRYGPELEDELLFEPGYQPAFQKLRRASAVIQGVRSTLVVLPPESAGGRWRHLAEAPEGSEVRAAASAVGDAWRALDASATNEAIARLGAAIEADGGGGYGGARAEVEYFYNRANLFEWGAWAYLLALVGLLLAGSTGRPWLMRTGVVLLFVALAVHTIGFGVRCYVADRFAIQNQFESMTGLSLFAGLVGAVLMAVRRQWLFGAAAALTGFLALIGATQTGVPGAEIEHEAAILNTSVLLKYHVTTVLTSYGLITLGFACSLFYLWTHYMGRAATPEFPSAQPKETAPGSDRPRPTRARTLKDLDAAQMTVLQLAFWTLGVGILLGAWWADHSWGRWWAFDPKETWALITWIIYLITLHVRLAGVKDKGLVTAWLSVVGFGVMLFTYFGVNLLLPGLHAYA